VTREPRILIIEDDQRAIDLVTFLLRDGGYDTLSATGGTEGLRILEETEVDLVILDLVMEDMDGWAVLRAIRTDDRFRTLPIVIISARHPLEYPRETSLLHDQFAGYLVKPFIVHDLLIKIEEVLQ
jgi:CheY-like chemotaxis protein